MIQSFQFQQAFIKTPFFSFFFLSFFFVLQKGACNPAKVKALTSSRPAEGAEHLISFETSDLCRRSPPQIKLHPMRLGGALTCSHGCGRSGYPSVRPSTLAGGAPDRHTFTPDRYRGAHLHSSNGLAAFVTGTTPSSVKWHC